MHVKTLSILNICCMKDSVVLPKHYDFSIISSFTFILTDLEDFLWIRHFWTYLPALQTSGSFFTVIYQFN